MGAYLSTPNTDKVSEQKQNDLFRYGSSSMQGWRQKQEDAHLGELTFGAHDTLASDTGFFAVFDGHGGGEVSKYAATKIKQHFQQVSTIGSNSTDEEFQRIIMDLDLDIREHFTNLCNVAENTNVTVIEGNENGNERETVQDLINEELRVARSGNAQMTREQATQLMMKVLYLQNKGDDRSQNLSDSMGCTAVSALIIPNKDEEGKIISYTVKATNSGDSRVLVWQQASSEVHGTKDHKPNDPEEKARIEAAGGEVREMNAGTDRVQYRVNGNLNLCRALGDYEYKKSEELPQEQQMITSCPDVYTWVCTPGDIVVLACDGIFDVLSNEETIQFVKDRIDTTPLAEICRQCMDHCMSDDPKETHGIGGDNMTIEIVHLIGGLDSNLQQQFPPNGPEMEVEVQNETMQGTN